MTTLMTSLLEIRQFNPCKLGWIVVLSAQGKTSQTVDAVEFSLLDALESNGVADICWLLGKRRTEISIAVSFAKKCADSVRHLGGAASYAASAASAASIAASYAASAADYAIFSASYAASAADYASSAYVAASADYAARDIQKKLNTQFMRDAITEYQNAH